MRRLLPFGLVGLVLCAFLAGRAMRAQLGIDLSPESLQLWVAALGWKAPVAFVALLTFRQFLFLPSLILLSVGGACFGTALGTALGVLGILLSALLKFTIARGIGRDWLRPRFGAAMRSLERRVERAGPFVVALATAHPTGPMGPLHWAAGFSALSLTAFVVAVALSAPIRAFACSFFGATLLAPGTSRFYLATGLLAAVVLLPLVHPGLRRRVLALGEDPQARA